MRLRLDDDLFENSSRKKAGLSLRDVVHLKEILLDFDFGFVDLLAATCFYCCWRNGFLLGFLSAI